MKLAKKVLSFTLIIALAVTMNVCPILADSAYAKENNDDKTISALATMNSNYGTITYPSGNLKIGQRIDIRVEGKNYNVPTEERTDGMLYYIPTYVVMSGGYDLSFNSIVIGGNYYHDNSYVLNKTTNKIVVAFNEFEFRSAQPTNPIKNREVRATFTVNAADSNVKVTLNANKGKIGKKNTISKTLKASGKYGKLNTPKRANYKFKGWYTAKKQGIKVTASSQVRTPNNHTLYAIWLGPKGKASTITKKEYNSLKKGMPMSDVNFLIGGSGKKYYESKMKWSGKNTYYYWIKAGGGIAVIHFLDGELLKKIW